MLDTGLKPVDQELASESAAPDAEAAISAWLNVFIRLLHLSESQRQAIRAELQEHLRERVRDLLLVGRSETESVRLAIEELGETIQLARRFEAANRPRIRRWLMNLALIGIASGAVVVSAFTLTPSAPTPAAVFQEQDAKAQVALEKLNELQVTKSVADLHLEDAIKRITEDIDVSVLIRKPELQAVDALGQPITLELKRTPLPAALDMLVQELSVERPAIEWRVVHGNVVEIGVKSEVDRREITLASYDIRTILNSICASFGRPYDNAVADVVSLLHNMVEPGNWRDNGGDLANLQVVGGRLFIQAPPRMHKQVEWILQQLREDAAADPQPQPEKSSRLLQERRSTLQPGDHVTVRIFELWAANEWFETTRQVDAEGKISLPNNIGDIAVTGLKRADVEARVIKALQTIITNPQVDVTVELKVPGESIQPAEVTRLSALQDAYKHYLATRGIHDPITQSSLRNLEEAYQQLGVAPAASANH